MNTTVLQAVHSPSLSPKRAFHPSLLCWYHGGASTALPLAGCHQLCVAQGGSLPAPARLLQPEIPEGKFQLLQWERERLLCGWEGLALPGSTTRLQRVCGKLSLQRCARHRSVLVVPGSCCVQLGPPACLSGSDPLKCSAS